MVLLWNKVMPSLHFLCPTLPVHLHYHTFSSPHSIPLFNPNSPLSKPVNMVRLTLYNTRPSSKNQCLCYTEMGQNAKSVFATLYVQVYTNASYGSVNAMTGTGATWSFVANILNICQYHLSACLSDTLQIFKVRFETLGGLQGSGVCSAKKQWNQ